MSHRGPSANPALVIPRAKVKRSSAERGSNAGMGGGYTNAGYHSDDDAVSHDEVCFISSICIVFIKMSKFNGKTLQA
jgi:hypothetical protein